MTRNGLDVLFVASENDLELLERLAIYGTLDPDLDVVGFVFHGGDGVCVRQMRCYVVQK